MTNTHSTTTRNTTMPAHARRIALAATTAVTMLLLAFTGTASAERNHSFERAIGSKGTAAGQMQLAAPVLEAGGGGRDETGGSGVAVNNTTGEIYVADTGNHRVDEYTRAGVFVRAFGFGVSTGANELQTCTSSCRAGKPGSLPGELQAPLFIAVDNTAGGEGDIYVGDTGDDLITKYTSEGELVGTWGNNGSLETPNGQLNGPAGEPFTSLRGLAADLNGHVWIDAEHASGIPEMFEYEPAGAPVAPGWSADAEPSGVAVNEGEELYTVDGYPNVHKFTSTGVGLGNLFSSPSVNFTGLAVDGDSGVLYLDQESQVGCGRRGRVRRRKKNVWCGKASGRLSCRVVRVSR